MYIGNTPNRPSLTLNDISLAVVYEVRDFCVIVDSRLKFDAHIHQTVLRAFVWANLIHKCFVTRNIFTLIRAYKVYVRPMVEYASCVWSPYHVSKTKQIVSVQRNFTKRLPGYALLNYEVRLSRLGLQSLEMRRLKYDLLYTYKIVYGLVSDAAINMFTLTNSLYLTCTRGHAYKLIRTITTSTCETLFSERVIAPWINLAATDDNFRTFSSLRRFLNSTDLTVYVSLGF